MNVWTAEDSAGDIHMVSAPTDQDMFTTKVIAYLQDIAEPGSPSELDIYEWPDVHTAGVWLRGDRIDDEGITWTRMALSARRGRVTYCWPGEFRYLADDENAPTPPAGLRPVTEDDLEAYEHGDPKREQIARAIERGGF